MWKSRGDAKGSPSEALMEAAWAGEEKAARALLEAGADPSARDRDGWTALMGAAQRGHAGMARMLLAAGADPTASDKNGWTALHAAAQRGHAGVARALLEAGAELEAQDQNRETPLIWAARYGKEEVAEALLEAGADPGKRGGSEESAEDLAPSPLKERLMAERVAREERERLSALPEGTRARKPRARL